VDVGGAAGQRDLTGIESDRDRGIRGQLRGGARMAKRERAFQVDKVADRDQQLVDERVDDGGVELAASTMSATCATRISIGICSPETPSGSSDHGVIQVDSMSHTTGSTGVTELKYREQLCGPGVVA
jgi:hypothetical protein